MKLHGLTEFRRSRQTAECSKQDAHSTSKSTCRCWRAFHRNSAQGKSDLLHMLLKRFLSSPPACGSMASATSMQHACRLPAGSPVAKELTQLCMCRYSDIQQFLAAAGLHEQSALKQRPEQPVMDRALVHSTGVHTSSKGPARQPTTRTNILNYLCLAKYRKSFSVSRSSASRIRHSPSKSPSRGRHSPVRWLVRLWSSPAANCNHWTVSECYRVLLSPASMSP